MSSATTTMTIAMIPAGDPLATSQPMPHRCDDMVVGALNVPASRPEDGGMNEPEGMPMTAALLHHDTDHTRARERQMFARAAGAAAHAHPPADTP